MRCTHPPLLHPSALLQYQVYICWLQVVDDMTETNAIDWALGEAGGLVGSRPRRETYIGII